MRSSPAKVRPSYVALGTRDRYFVSFHDGTQAYKGPKGLERELKKINKPPLSVAFGNTWDTFFIVLSDGSWRCQGRGIPAGLERKLSEREDRPDLVCVTLGPDGEGWFMKAENGQMWWGGISDELDENIRATTTQFRTGFGRRKPLQRHYASSQHYLIHNVTAKIRQAL
jgi:hypothetical protein